MGHRAGEPGGEGDLDYLTINLLVLMGPLLLSFDRRVHFFRKWRPLAASIAIISPIYIAWDAVATHRGDWGFNPDHVSDITLLGLPLAEVLFFVTVPYACIFIYECILYWIGDREVPFNVWPYVLAAVALLLLAVAFIDQYYTFTVLVFTAAFLYVAAVLYPRILRSGAYWLYVLVSLVPFFGVNYILTSIPIVEYNDAAIWGIRITTIPLEDLIYNFSMLSLYLLTYLYFKRRWGVDTDNEAVPIEVGTGRGVGEGV
jgi:lycopene cyclase domain-containing protein